uniref:Uncharacterized protein n=1 Tax=Mastacembelus armatus TaxID=205130 RepID=A0A7N9AKT6_9TELE
MSAGTSGKSLLLWQVVKKLNTILMFIFYGNFWVCVLGVNCYNNVICGLVPVMATGYLLFVL